MVGRFKVGHQKRGEADHECGHGGWLYTPYLSRLRDSFTLRTRPNVYCLHAHCSVDGRYLVCDSTERFYRGCATSVHFMDRQTGKTLKLIDNPALHNFTGANYHIDPHPRFCCDDRFVVFTTTVRGRVDVAVVRIEDLVG